MSTTRLQEVQICFGFGKQTDIATANLVAAMWRLKKLNAQLANPKLNTENDAEENGKGHEFATTTFKTSWDTGGTLEKYLRSEEHTSEFQPLRHLVCRLLLGKKKLSHMIGRTCISLNCEHFHTPDAGG